MKRFVRFFNLIILALVTCCVEPIDFDIPAGTSQLVVEGFISNEPGPYIVTLSRARAVNENHSFRIPVNNAVVKLFSDAGEEVRLTEQSPGSYTTNGIQGVVGRSYWITIESNGSVFESEHELIRPAGEIDAINYEYEHKTKIVDNVERNDDRFNVFINSRTQAEGENYFRWRVTGTYKIETRPDLITVANPFGFGRIPAPPPCSGWVVRGNGALERTGGCSCCVCWVTNYEPVPQVSDDQLIEGNEFTHVRVGTVPISPVTFYDKYHVSVSQMAISKQAFNFFRLIKAQKEGATSLFQPVSGKLRGNVTAVSGDEEVLGIFWAAGVHTRVVYIDRTNLPVYPGALQDIILECTALKNSTATKPAFWQ